MYYTKSTAGLLQQYDVFGAIYVSQIVRLYACVFRLIEEGQMPVTVAVYVDDIRAVELKSRRDQVGVRGFKPIDAY